MSEVWEKLLTFVPPGIINRLAENEEQIYDLLDSATSEIIGSYSLGENGKLIHFEIEGEPRAGNLSKEEIADIAEGFIGAIYQDQKEFELSAVQSSIWEILIGLFMKKEMKSTGYFYIVQDLLFPFRLPAR